MSSYLTPSHPQTSHYLFALCMANMRWRRKGSIPLVFGRWNIVLLPLVFSSTGGLGQEAKVMFKRLGSLLAAKWNKPYSATFSYISCSMSFSLLQSSVSCIRGHRFTCGDPMRVQLTPVDVILSEKGFSS